MSYWDEPIMKNLLDDFKVELEFARLNFSKYFQQDEACILYHYTRDESLINILRSKSLWVTNIEYLNDKSEFTYGINLVNRIIENKLYDTQYKIRLKSMIDKFSKRIGSFYIFSLTKNYENLLLWTNYAGTDGLSIGIDYSRMSFFLKDLSFDDSEEFIKSNFDVYDGNVIYSLQEQEKIINESLDRIYSIYEKYQNVSNTEQFQLIDSSIFYEIIHFITLFKDKCFSPEEEYRFVFEKGENIHTKYRKNNGMNLPYISLDFNGSKDDINEIPILEIGLGPKNNMSNDEINSIVNMCSYQNVAFYKSRIPIR